MGPATAFTLGALAFGAALYGLHRLALRLERKGHIYYLHSQPSGSALGNAALSVQSLLEPGKRYVVEERQAETTERRESGDPPVPADPTDDAETGVEAGPDEPDREREAGR
jgi:hypothetical protein